MHLVSRHKFITKTAFVLCGLVFVPQAQALALSMGPVDASGHLGYYYRSFAEDGGSENISHQLGGTVNASTYFGEPWLATSYLSLSLTQDSSETSSTSSQSTNDSQLTTGDFGLNILPQSRTPFRALLQVTDTRVTATGSGFTPITFVGEDFSSTYLGLNQAFMTDTAGRYELSYDMRSWESTRSGEYDDTTLGLSLDFRKPQQHMMGRGTFSTNEHSLVSRKNESLILDLSHFYYPKRHYRIDSKVSYYDYDRSFLDPSSSDTRLTTLNITQLSSNAFWRPANYPLSFTAGVRVYAMEGKEGSVAGNDVDHIVLNSGLFYQLNQNLRLDASFTSLFGSAGGVDENVHQQHAGFLYQTDWAEWRKFMYQAYLDGDVGHRADVNDDITDLGLTAGHGFGRTVWLGERTSSTSLRLNLSQSGGLHSSSGSALGSSSGTRIDHSATVAFNQRAWGGNTLAQLSLSDSRDAIAQEDASGVVTNTDIEQQLVNFQLSRDQDLGRRSSITGDITLQRVLVKRESSVAAVPTVTYKNYSTASTGRIMFQHFQLLGVPRLQFSSDLMISHTSTEGAISRTEWENRVSYMIGKLETNLSYRLTETDSRNYDLLYFRLMRRF